MQTQPDPKQMFVISGPRLATIHLGFTEISLNKEKKRPICNAKMPPKTERVNYSTKNKVNCHRCLKRLNSIIQKIQKLGVEWVCNADYLPMEQRTFQSRLPANIKIKEQNLSSKFEPGYPHKTNLE